MSGATIKPEDLPIGPFTRIVTAYPAFALPSASTTTSSSNKKGKIIGGVIGGVVGLLLLLALLWFLLRWRKRRSRTRKGHEELGDSDTAAPTPVQKQSEDRPQIAQVRGAVTVPPAAVLPTSTSTTAAAPTARNLTTDPATGERSSAYDTLAPLPTDLLSASPAGSPPGSSLGHGLAVPPAALTGRPDSPLSFSSLRHARSPSLSSVLSDYVDASEIAATPISASESSVQPPGCVLSGLRL